MTPKHELHKYLGVVAFVQKCHGEQVRRDTLVPYYTHPIRVANLVMKYKRSRRIDDLVLAALMHDLVEDTNATLADVESVGGLLAASLVEELTSDPKAIRKMGKTEYLKQKMARMSNWGLVIKLCDRLDNVNDFLYATPKFVERYAEETWTLLKSLPQLRELTGTQKTIIADIRKVVDTHYDPRPLWEKKDLALYASRLRLNRELLNADRTGGLVGQALRIFAEKENRQREQDIEERFRA